MRAFDKKKGENSSSNTFFSPKIQTKLQTGTPGDRYEVEADKAADKVVNKPTTGGLLQSKSEEIQQKPLAENISMVQKQDMKEEKTVQKKTEEKEETVQKKEEEKETVQAKCKACEEEGKVQKKSNEEEKPVQTKSDASQPKTSSSSLETNLNRSKGSGQKMEKSTQHEMEAGFGSDFSNVTIHTDSNAVQMSEELGAHAFTHGNDVYFNNGKYNPNTKEGKHLLAHELTHTVQQTGMVQKKIGDGHDLKSPRFSGDERLEGAFDNENYIQNGAQGEHVHKIQQALEDSGYPLPKFGVDGIFGSETKSSVKNYQATKNLSIDGIVGTETMESLDSLFSKPIPEVPPGPLNVCEVLQNDSYDKYNQQTFFPIKVLSPNLKKAANDSPTTELPNGDTAIKCNTPLVEKKCSELCGCPLPLEPTGPEIKIGDVCKPKRNSVFVGESCPDENDVLRVIEIIENSGKIKSNSTSNENDWLKVKICEGPNKGKINIIQQRFVRQVEPLSLSIVGSNNLEKSKKMKLKVDGLPSTLTPLWEIKQLDKGEANIIGSNNTSEVEIEGKTESGKKDDIEVTVKACDDHSTHKLTIESEKFVPPSGPCKPSPVDIMRIPGVMRAKSMIKGATLMENWFIGPSSAAPSYGKSDSKTITKSWLSGFSIYNAKIE